MSENTDIITALARLEEAERENQKLRSERILAEHARDEAQRDAISARDLAEIAIRGGSHWKKRADSAKARVRELEAMLSQISGYVMPFCSPSDTTADGVRKLDARLRAVTEAGQLMRDWIGDNEEAITERWDAACSADLPSKSKPHVCALNRALNGECFVCGSVDERIAAEQKEADERHAKAQSADLSPHADTERLDWLEKETHVFQCTSDATDFSVILAKSRIEEHGGPFNHVTLRAAIDAARAQAGKEASS